MSNSTSADLTRIVRDMRADAVFISAFCGNHIESLALAARVRKIHPDMVTVIGGPFAVLGAEILRQSPAVDFVISGEGERSSVLLLDALAGKAAFGDVPGLSRRAGGRIEHTTAGFSDDIDEFAYLPSELVGYCRNVAPENWSILITSRGCPDRCLFCSSPALWARRVRYHTIDVLIRYLKDLRQTTGAIYFSIRDDNFLANRGRVAEFAHRLSREKLYYVWNTQGSARFVDDTTGKALAEAGCDQVQMGIESGSPELLRFLNKKIDLAAATASIATLRRHAIRPFGYFIGGLNETPEQARATMDFIRRSGIMDGVISPLVIYPGTGLAAEALTDSFFGKKEILYYHYQSYTLFRDRYIAALTCAHEKRRFTLKELHGNHSVGRMARHFEYLYRGNRAAAEKELNEFVVAEPRNPWPFILRGQLYMDVGRHDAARPHFMTADRLLDGKNAEIHSRAGAA